MTRVLVSTTAALALLGTAPAAPAQEESLAAGADYLRGLGDGAQVTLTAPDGSSVKLEAGDGALHLAGEGAVLADGKLTTPGGYTIYAVKPKRKVEFGVEAPAGGKTHFYFDKNQLFALEADLGVWSIRTEVLVAYLPDGTRLDFDRPEGIIQISSQGESWRLEGVALVPTTEPPTTLSAVNPITVYQTGDGDDWVQLTNPKATLPWFTTDNAYPVDVMAEHARGGDGDWIAAALRQVAPENRTEAGAYLLAGYFALPPGSFVSFGDDGPTLVLPGRLQIPTFREMKFEGPTTMP